MAQIEPGHFVFISIPMGDAKFVTKEGREGKGRRGGQPPILSRISNIFLKTLIKLFVGKSGHHWI